MNNEPMDMYMHGVRKKGSPLDAQTERDLAIAFQSGDYEAGEKLFLSIAALVVHLAKHYQSRGIEFDDLVCVGNLGAWEAIRRFDPEKGCRLTTYASYWIKQAMGRETDTHGSTIRVPRLAEISDPEMRERAATIRGTTTSLSVDVPTADREREINMDFMVGPTDGEEPHEVAIRNESIQRIRNAIQNLPSRQRKIIRARMEGMSLTVIGEEMGICKERVRQLQQKALKRFAQLLRVPAIEEKVFRSGWKKAV